MPIKVLCADGAAGYPTVASPALVKYRIPTWQHYSSGVPVTANIGAGRFQFPTIVSLRFVTMGELVDFDTSNVFVVPGGR